MNRRPRRDGVKEQFWRKAIAKFKASGLSKSRFCRQEDLSIDVLLYWTETIAKRDEEQSLAEPPQDRVNEKTFLPLFVAREQNICERLPGTKQMAVAEMPFAEGSVFLFNGVTKETVQALWFGIGFSKLHAASHFECDKY